MPQKRPHIFHKVLNRVSIFISRVRRRRPRIPKLVISLNKARKLKRFKLLKHEHNFLEDYEFSASSTPLIRYNERQLRNGIRRGGRNLYSMLVLCRCLGGLKDEGEAVDWRLSLEALPAAIADICSETLDLWEEDQDSVDRRAERFIERFYQDMRLQRQGST
ncbi:hypothetical protein HS088_TW02G00932 [Tripterygium wilfordii]|uniref:Uncharacterized protein n=1 Tax=Tripterygium wilfordii TaxID=458696 RepID=A0A7J7E037_TRIWF|nr:uncharacterized protein LOC119981503 [Tripterygium wilfordii]KAF5751913.1 hypothetical protein HS088_TW02G00932 [Tripterygium wilfordii]